MLDIPTQGSSRELVPQTWSSTRSHALLPLAGNGGGNSVATAAIIADSALAQLYTYWTGKCAGRAMPRRADINPRDILNLLPQVFIADIHAPLRFRFRLVGTDICHRWNENLTGKWVDEMSYDGERDAVLEQFASVARTGTPRVDTEKFVSGQNRYLHYRRLLLPLSEDGQVPTTLFGLQKAIGADDYPVAPKWL